MPDRDAARPLMAASRSCFPLVDLLFADAGHPGPPARETCPVLLEIDCASYVTNADHEKYRRAFGAFEIVTMRRALFVAKKIQIIDTLLKQGLRTD